MRRSASRLPVRVSVGGSLAGLVGDPVHLPALARRRLRRTARSAAQRSLRLSPVKFDQDALVVQRVLRVELCRARSWNWPIWGAATIPRRCCWPSRAATGATAGHTAAGSAPRWVQLAALQQHGVQLRTARPRACNRSPVPRYCTQLRGAGEQVSAPPAAGSSQLPRSGCEVERAISVCCPLALTVGGARVPGRVFAGGSGSRDISEIQLTSQVLPPSADRACSKCTEFAVIFDHT